MRIFIALALSALLAACVSHDYIGERYAPTQHVNVYYDASAVPDGYRVIGQDRAQSGEAVTTEDIVADMVEKAKEIGADGLLIEGVDEVVVGSTSTAPTSLNTVNTTVQKNKVVTGKFLKRS